MWPVLILIYAAGLAVTAVSVFRSRVFTGSYLLNTCAAILWPAYWTVFLALVFTQRTPRS